MIESLRKLESGMTGKQTDIPFYNHIKIYIGPSGKQDFPSKTNS